MVTKEHVAQWLHDYTLPASAVCLVADIPDPALSLWLRGKKELTPSQLDRLEEALYITGNITHDSFAPVNWRSQAILPVIEGYRAARRQYLLDTAAATEEARHASSGE